MQDIDKLKENYNYFLSIKNDLLSDPEKKGKYIVIHNQQNRGIYDSFESACVWASGQFPRWELYSSKNRR